jgi:anti-sigma factor RsiW
MSEFFYRVRFRRDHRWAPVHMSGYLDAELASSRRTRMERHVTECSQCRRLLATLRQLLDALHRLPAPTGTAAALQMADSVRRRLKEPPGLG